MTYQEFRDILYNGVWKQNTGVVQLLGMCPILAVSSSVVNGVSLGLATSVVMALSVLRSRRSERSSRTKRASRCSF